MEEIATPSFADTSNRRQVIADTRRDKDSACRQHAATGEAHEEARLDRGDSIPNNLHAVPRKLIAACSQQLGGWHPVARQVALHMRGGSVARRSGVYDGDCATRTAEYESCAETGCAATDDDYVIDAFSHCCTIVRGVPRIGNVCC
jgi:hypothetical protein